MYIYDVRAEQLPLFTVEVLSDNAPGGQQEWCIFTLEPFATEAEAKAHADILIDSFRTWSCRIRVGRYTREMWRSDLIKAVLSSRDAMARALSLLRNETLADLLKPEATNDEEAEGQAKSVD